jgi:exopolysaccharide production protein ExoZ
LPRAFTSRNSTSDALKLHRIESSSSLELEDVYPIATLIATPAPAKIAQIDGVQILRAVAVFLVAWLHAGQTLGDWRVVELPHFTAFGIDIFFVISGFIMASTVLRNRHPPGVTAAWAFLKRRLIRIFPIYWLFAVVYSLRLLHGHGFFLHNYFPSYLLLPGLYPRYPLVVAFSWTMVFEMLFYYSLAAILLVTVKRAVPLSIVLFSWMVLLGNALGPAWVDFTSPLLLEFIFGAICATAFLRFGQRRIIGIALVGVGVLGALYMRSHPQQGGATGIDMALSSIGAMRHVLTWGAAAALIVSGVVLWSPQPHSLPGRVAVILGNASYSAYLASSLILEFASRILISLGGRPSITKEIAFQLTMVGAVLAVGWLSYEFVELRMIRWLRAATGS